MEITDYLQTPTQLLASQQKGSSGLLVEGNHERRHPQFPVFHFGLSLVQTAIQR